MFVPTTSGAVLAPTDVDSGSGAAINGSNSTAITATNNSSMNALTMFLFWFFLCSTGVLVVGSMVVLRRLKQREQTVRKDGKAKKAAAAASKDMDEESSIGSGGSTVSLAPVPARTHAGTTTTRAESA